jgi:hypothetical protein
VLEEEDEQHHPEDDENRLDDAAGQIADHEMWCASATA